MRLLLLSNLFFFAIASLLFALFRDFILTTTIISDILAICWVLIVPLTNVVIITVLAYEINEKTKIPSLRPKTSTTLRSHDNSFTKTAISNKNSSNNNNKGILVQFDQTISSNDSSIIPDSNIIEPNQDYIETLSDPSHFITCQEGSGEQIELVTDPKHYHYTSYV